MDLSELPRGPFLRHPWEIARARFFVSELERAGVLTGRILDVGSGDAWFAEQLTATSRNLEVTCWDTGYAARVPGARERLHLTATRPDGGFDAALLLDVTEHVPDDRAFLGDVLALVKPGGRVLFSVPAWPILYSRHDEALGHYRRYTPPAARGLLVECGLSIERSGGLFHTLLLPRFLMAQLERAQGGSGRHVGVQPELAWTRGKLSQSAVARALALDGTFSRIAADLDFPLPGLSWWALCRK